MVVFTYFYYYIFTYLYIYIFKDRIQRVKEYTSTPITHLNIQNNKIKGTKGNIFFLCLYYYKVLY